MTTTRPACYDLHLHTCWSYDADASVRPYFERARELGMRCIAITEHHSLDSAAEVAATAAEFPDIRLIVAAELSVNTSFGAVDLLCYNLPRDPQGEFAAVLMEYRAWVESRGLASVEAMQSLGYDFTVDHLHQALAEYRPARVNAVQGAAKLPMAKLMAVWQQRGFAKTDEELLQLKQQFLEAEKRMPYPAVERVVSAVKTVGGLVVLAHPTVYVNDRDRDRLDALRIECSLDGIECAHRKVAPELTEFYRSYCLEHGLVSTAGSDCHAATDSEPYSGPWGYTPKRRFGSHIGQPEWLDEFLAALASPTAC